MSNIFKSRIEKTFFRQKQKTIIKIHVFISVGHSFKTEISQQQISISIFIFILYQSLLIANFPKSLLLIGF